MSTKNEMVRAGELAAEFFGNGYHCAEAVAAAVVAIRGEQDSCNIVSLTTGFGGGFGESFSEACGVITGSLIVIGYLHGRKNQGDSWRDASQLAGAVVETFKALHGTCNCGELRNRFKEEEQMQLCRKIVKIGTENLMGILRETEK